MFSDLFLGNGGVVNWNNGNMTVEHAAGLLNVAGGNFQVGGILSGSSDAFFGQYGVSYVSASNGSLQATNYISGSDIKGVSGDLGSLSVGNVTSTGTISGSAVYGTTIGQNRTDGLKTITIEANSTVNQDLTSDATVTFGSVKSAGIISGSTEAFIGQYGVSYVSASAGSIQATNYVSGSEIKAPQDPLEQLILIQEQSQESQI